MPPSYPSEFQRNVFNTLAILGLSQTIIVRDRGTFILKSSTYLQRIPYIILRINTFLKLIFLVLLSCGFLQSEFEFFEKMAIVLWFLILILLTTSERIWCRTYPFFEIITSWWNVQERVFDRLGKPDNFVKDVKHIAFSRIWFQGIIAIVGILAVAVQYDAAPKYCTFAFSIIESEDPLLKWLFGAHEIIFLTHAWLVYGSVIYVSSALGAEFTYTVESLREVLEGFVEDAHIRRKLYRETRIISVRKKRFSRGSSALLTDDKQGSALSRAFGDSHSYVDPFGVIRDYVNVRMVVTQLNNFAAYNFLYMHACSYIQMISDVFQLIQILRMPEASIVDALFFAEDMMVCMYMLFRCFKAMAFLHPSSLTFLEKYNDLCAMSPPNMTKLNRMILRKMKRTTRTTAFYLGPSIMRVGFVGTAMDVLLQYYICVALWK